MNPNKQSKSGQPKSDIELSEINDLDDIDISDKPSSSINKKDFLFNSTSNLSDSNPIQLNFESPLEEIKVDNAPSLIGSLGKTESTDGFKSFTEIPVNPQIKVPDEPKLTGKALLKEKFSYLRKLEALEKRGITLSKKYSMESSLDEMKGEYEMIKSEKKRIIVRNFSLRC